MIVADAIAEFRRHHRGQLPAEVLVSPAAAIVIVALESLPPICDGVGVRIAKGMVAERAGAGARVALVVGELPGGREAVLAGECR